MESTALSVYETESPASGLSLAELEIVSSALERMDDEALRLGMDIRIETDFDEFVRLRRQSAEGAVSPTLNPEFSHLERDAFWLQVLDLHGSLLAIFGAKIFRTANFMDLMRNERLWFDRGLRVVSPELRVIDHFGRFGGVVSHGAGMWVHPAARGRGISAFLPDYLRALAVKNYAVDWHTMFVFEQHQDHALKAYGYSSIEKVIDGFCPITSTNTKLYLGRMTRQDIIDRLVAPRKITKEARPAPVAAAG